MGRNRVLALVSAGLFLAVIGCGTKPGQLFDPAEHDPASIAVDPGHVSIDAGQSADVTVTVSDVLDNVLSTSQWTPKCTVKSDKPDVATVSIVGGKVHVVGHVGGSAQVTITCSATVKKTFTVEVKDPVPTITAVSPQPLIRGTATTLAITGTGFQSGTVVEVGGVGVTVLSVGAGGATVEVPASATLNEEIETLSVRAHNTPNGAWSDPVQVALAYPIPFVTAIDPMNAEAGSSPGEVRAFGGGIFRKTVIRWAGSNLVTTFKQFPPAGPFLAAEVPASLVSIPGTYLVTLFTPGPGGGTSNSRPFVVSPPAGAQTSTFDFSSYEPTLVWAAVALGSNPFVQTPIDGKIVEFQVTAPTASLAVVTSLGSNLRSALRAGSGAAVVTYQLTVFSMTREEMAGTHRMGFRSGTNTLSGSVTGLGAGQVGSLVWGNGEVTTSGTFSMANASPGPHALAGYRRAILSIAASDRVFMRQNQASASGVVVDFNGAESAPVATASATLAGLIAGDNATGLMAYSTEPTCEGTRFYSTQAAASHLVTGVPSGLQGANDVHIYTMLIINGSKTLQQTFYSKPLMAFAGTRPAEVTPTVTNFASAPYTMKQAVFDLGSAYHAATLFHSNTAVTATRGFLGGSAGTIRTPDLSGVAGWNSAWAPSPGGFWGFGVSSSTAVAPTCADGSVVSSYFVNGSN